MAPSPPSHRPSRSARLLAIAAILAQFACGRQDVELATWIAGDPVMEDAGSTAPRGATAAADAASTPAPKPCVPASPPPPPPPATCIVEGESCQSDQACCSLRCDGKDGQCKEPHGQCRPAGESCAPGFDACCGRCDLTTLRCAPSACAAAGAGCEHDQDCCDGACSDEGTCAPPAAPPCDPVTPPTTHTR